jgi:xylulokinase
MDYSLAGRTMLTDVHTQDWPYQLFTQCRVDADLFYPLAPSDQIVGQIDSTYAEPLGLHAGVSVVAGGFDQSCCAMGAGVLESGMAALSVGTLEAITAVYDAIRLEPPLLEGNYGCIFHIVEGFYVSLGYVTTSGAVLRWYRNTLGSSEVQEANRQHRDPYDVMIGSTPDCPSSVYVLPYFAGTGTPWLDVNQRGTIFGLSLDTDRAEIIKGILDGICYEIRLNLETLAAADIQVHRLRAIGGGAKSDRWMQLKADITGVPVETTTVTEAGCLGAAFLAGQGLGIYTLPSDILDIATVNKVFEPRPGKSRQYEESYQTYKELRLRVKGLRI